VKLDGLHLILPCRIRANGKRTKAEALVDSGANGMAFIDQAFAQKLELKLERLRNPRRLEVVDGRQSVAGRITHLTRITIDIDGHKELLSCFVTKLSQQPIVLGIPWLKCHDTTISWRKNTLTFNSRYCHENCGIQDQLEIQGITSDEITKDSRAAAAEPLALDIRMIGASPFVYLTDKARKRSKDFVVFAASMADIEKALAPKKKIDPKTKLPLEYHEFLDVFSQKEADKLPPHRGYDHKIKMKEGSEPPFGPLYDMSREELLVLRQYLEENLGKGFIRASRSPAASPVLFVRKPGGGLRFCVDYRALNALTVKNRYPIPLIRETLDRLCKARYYTKLDIIAAFNRLRIAQGDEWKTAFRTRYGLFEYLVMPFGLTNGPASFQHYVNDALREYLDLFCTAYLDDILIYSNSLKEHRKHVAQVLQRLREHGLQADIAKCEFHVQEVKYLGLIVSTDGIQMDPAKVSAVKEWPTPHNVKDIQSFLGFANFYRRFIREFAKKASALTRLTRKDIPFDWDENCQTAFEELKIAFTSAPILRHFDPDQPSTIECDASDYVTAGCLSQPDADGILHPVAFFSRKMSPAECNYDIYDKELMAVVQSFEEWRAELEGAAFPVQVISDHKNLQHFMTTKRLSRRQARWSEYLSRFDFQLTYRPGTQGGKPDALTRRSSDMPQLEDDERLRYQEQTILKSHNISPGMQPLALKQNTLRKVRDDTPLPLEDLIAAAYVKDPLPAKIKEAMSEDGGRVPTELARLKIPVNEMIEKEGRLFWRNRMFVPDDEELRLRLLRSCHDKAAAGHPGRAKTYELLSRDYYWPKMGQTVQRYVRNCHTCSRSKTSRLPYQGLLQPLNVPSARWEDIAVDFIVESAPKQERDDRTILQEYHGRD
jgi:Retroviral aspartyl protease./Reverse transcriptase (RNA-dependent DNA polymerase).